MRSTCPISSTPLISSGSSVSLSSLLWPLEILNLLKSSEGGDDICTQVRQNEVPFARASAVFMCEAYGMLDTMDVGRVGGVKRCHAAVGVAVQCGHL